MFVWPNDPKEGTLNFVIGCDQIEEDPSLPQSHIGGDSAEPRMDPKSQWLRSPAWCHPKLFHLWGQMLQKRPYDFLAATPKKFPHRGCASSRTPPPTVLGPPCSNCAVQTNKQSAPNHKSQVASDLKSRSPNRKKFPQIAVLGSSNHTSNRAIYDLNLCSNRR